MVISRGLERAAPSIECPRCGSALVVPAMPGGPSENVLQLRSGSPPTGWVGPFDEWLCRSCGLRWPHERPPAEVALGAHPGSATSAIPGERIEPVDLPEVEGASSVTSGRVAATLREAREARGLTVSDAAKATLSANSLVCASALRSFQVIGPVQAGWGSEVELRCVPA